MSNFSLSHSVFYPFQILAAIDVQFKIVFWKLFHFGRVKNLLVGKGLNLWKLNTFTEDKLCMAENVVFVFDDFEKIVGKGENAGFHIVFKSPVSVVQNQGREVSFRNFLKIGTVL